MRTRFSKGYGQGIGEVKVSYDHIFVYHNGAESYYVARGFRDFLRA
ncbi:DUF4256 domain-containing protein [Sporosarcina siberiensis]|uniref:DUF4256 domain-containing protein n=1 Tax=Sporosarcina siberiensis TaxID=1365606 RepID=A0ABW4SHQ7_9BACL